MIKRSLLVFLGIFAGVQLSAQTNTFPATGNTGIGTTTPGVPLHLKPVGTEPTWIGLDKNDGMETGLQFLKNAGTQFYFYTDNDDNDALKIQSTAAVGETDGYPRILIPYNNNDLYLGLSGGNVAIGHGYPYSSSRLHIKAAVGTPWTLISEASANDRIIGLSHDGTNGMVSTGYLGDSGFSPIQFLTSNFARMRTSVDGQIGISTTLPRLTVQQSYRNWSQGIRLSLMDRIIVADTDGERLAISKKQNSITKTGGCVGASRIATLFLKKVRSERYVTETFRGECV